MRNAANFIGKFIALCVFIRNEETSKIDNLIFHFRKCWIEKFNIVRISVVPNLIYRFNAFSKSY